MPSRIVGIEGYTLLGEDAGIAAVLSWKRRFGQWKAVNFNAGPLVGFSESTDKDLIFGGVIEAEAAKIGGLVLVPRGDGGFRFNYGYKLTLVGWSF